MTSGVNRMRVALSFFMLSLLSPAFADDNESAWIVDELVSRRFAEGDTQGPRFEEGSEVSVVYREGSLVRVNGTNGFGWVAESAITTEKPALSDVDLEAMMERIKAMNLDGGGGMSQPITIGGNE